MLDKLNSSQKGNQTIRLTIQTIWPFIVIVALLLAVMLISLRLTASARAYVGGESLWSKGQKEAALALISYARSADAPDYQVFLKAIAVPLGDHVARLSMNESPADVSAAYRGFRLGGNSPKDSHKMVWLYRYFSTTPLMKKPIEIWSKADAVMLKLNATGFRMNQIVENGKWKRADTEKYIDTILNLNKKVTPLEMQFSQSVATTSDQLYEMIEVLMATLTALLMSLGIMFSWRLARQRIADSQELTKESEMNLTMLHNASDGVHILDNTGSIVEVSDSFCTMLGYSRDECMGMNVGNWDAKLTSLQIEDRINQLQLDKTRVEFETEHRRRDGTTFNVEIAIMPIELDGRFLLYCSSRDITLRIQAEAVIRESQERLEALYAGAPDGILVADNETRQLTDVNPKACVMLGYTREELMQLEYAMLHKRADFPRIMDSLKRATESGFLNAQDVPFLRKDGSEFIADINFALVKIDNRTHLVGFIRDVTERKEAELQIQHLAYHDQLTGLPNRTLLIDRFEQVLTTAQRHKFFGAALFLDLDHFKEINDVHGHPVGDRVLQNIALRLRSTVREEDTVARLGGDEFMILLPNIANNHDDAALHVLTVGNKILESVICPIQLDGNSYTLTASIGVVLFPESNSNVADLIRKSDIAMYQAKQAGRNALVFYEHQMKMEIEERYTLEHRLREAIESGSLELYFQSQVNQCGEICGAEALARWEHPDLGSVSPARFIPVAESSGLIISLGEWILLESCRYLASLANQGHHIRIAVNVSPRQFQHPNFVDRVKEILIETNANPSDLTLEITENLLIDSKNLIAERMTELQSLGVRFAIDDFGTGYSSLAYLKRLPINEIKIDQSFVRDLPHDQSDMGLVETMLSIAKHMNMEVVAEGVENRDQLDFMINGGCNYFQGYYFHKPEPAREWLQRLMV